MGIEEITKLAKSNSTGSKEDLDLKLTELKSDGCSILECIIYVRVNQNCSLMDAKSIVVNSSAWIDDKEEFIKHQQEQMEEFIDAAKDDIESIRYTYTPEKTEVTIKMKTKK